MEVIGTEAVVTVDFVLMTEPVHMVQLEVVDIPLVMDYANEFSQQQF